MLNPSKQLTCEKFVRLLSGRVWEAVWSTTINHNRSSGFRRFRMGVYLRGKSYHYRFLCQRQRLFRRMFRVFGGSPCERIWALHWEKKYAGKPKCWPSRRKKSGRTKQSAHLWITIPMCWRAESPSRWRRHIRLHCKSRAVANRRNRSPDRNCVTGTTLFHTRQPIWQSIRPKKIHSPIDKTTSPY